MHSLHIPLGPVPYRIDVPAGHFAVLRGSCPMGLDYGSTHRHGSCVLLASDIRHSEHAKVISIKALGTHCGEAVVTFRPHFTGTKQQPEQADPIGSDTAAD